MGRYSDVVRIHRVWVGMHRRCNHNDGGRDWQNYGGRGITVCRAWSDFEVFCEWALDSGYQKGLQIDRKNNDRGYSPSNCRWVDRHTNGQNKRNNAHLTAFGETKTLSQWARDPRCKVAAHVLSSRRRDGWEHERAITTPSTRSSDKCINGHSRKKYTVKRANGQRYCKRCQADRSNARYHRLMQAKRKAAGQYDN